MASAGRPGLELQIPAPVGRQQRRHVQHAGVHADPRQPERAPLLQLPSRGLPGLTARGRQAPSHPPHACPWSRGLQRRRWLQPFVGTHAFAAARTQSVCASWRAGRSSPGGCKEDQTPPLKAALPVMRTRSAFTSWNANRLPFKALELCPCLEFHWGAQVALG